MKKKHIDADGLSQKSLKEIIDDPDFPKDELAELVEDLRVAKSFGKYNDLSDLMNAVSEAARGFGTESIREEDLQDRYWGDTRGVYINMGDQYALTLIFDAVDNQFYVTDYETYVMYVESQQTPVWEIPMSIEDEAGGGHGFTAWVKAETLEEAVEQLANEIEWGDTGLWGDDDRFDISVDMAEGPGADPEHQLWYITGMDDSDDYTEEEREAGEDMMTKAMRMYPSQAKQVTKEDVRHDERYFEAS